MIHSTLVPILAWLRPSAPSLVRLLVCVLALLGVAAALPSLPGIPSPAAQAAATIKWPFAAGSGWYISQGYNTSPVTNWSHYNCDPVTQKDAISQTRTCSNGYQYKYSFDIKKSSGETTGQVVLSPVSGTIKWIDEAFGGMSIYLGNGYAYAFFHVDLAANLVEGQQIQVGQFMGTVSGPGDGGNGGSPHIHVTIWQTTDEGNWSRNAVPFTDQYQIDGYDFPALDDTTTNQHYLKGIWSTNSPIATSSLPGMPTLISPAQGVNFTSTNPQPTLTWKIGRAHV